jgi:hypothetical protein
MDLGFIYGLNQLIILDHRHSVRGKIIDTLGEVQCYKKLVFMFIAVIWFDEFRNVKKEFYFVFILF